jgi:Flp pilus assembly protein TadG
MSRRNERGSVSVELVLLTPVLVGLMCLTVAFGRLQSARADVEAASRAAARAASFERTAPAARVAGQRAALAELDAGGYRCSSLVVSIDTGTFAPDATVGATVSCTVQLADVTGMGLPSSHTMSATFNEPIDRFRGTR